MYVDKPYTPINEHTCTMMYVSIHVYTYLFVCFVACVVYECMYTKT